MAACADYFISLPMHQHYVEGKIFNAADIENGQLLKGDYEGCTFNAIDFSNADLSGITFIECIFSQCNLSGAQVSATGFQDVTFDGCKMVGLLFDAANPFLFSIRCNRSALDFCSFQNFRLRDSTFTDCSLQEADLTGAEIQKISFNGCDLQRAVFHGTNLEGADFRTAFNFSIHPEENRVKGAKFSASGVMGLLEHYGIIVE